MIDSFRGKYFFLSNLYRKPMIIGGLLYPTLEHAFQAAKCCSPEDARTIRLSANPSRARQIGRHVNLIHGWEKKRLGIMEQLLFLKFSDWHLKERLVATGNQTLIEGNLWHDNFWGDCGCVQSRCEAPGFNHLGRLLMKIRDQ